ncbi:MAG: FAD-dependent oxidoreductase [Campylobacterota bacterium]|nr:FAD-dependent oxidoreductase [Campylobacterota bacterium]
MRVVIVGGGIAATYLANNLKKLDASVDVVVVSDEKYAPYDRIHLCRLIDNSEDVKSISLTIDPTVRVELNQKIISIDREKKRVLSENSMFSYDKLIIATGSTPSPSLTLTVLVMHLYLDLLMIVIALKMV